MTQAAEPTTRVRVRFRHANLPGRNTAGFRFNSRWSEVDATAAQLKELKADPHLIVLAPDPTAQRPEAMTLEELQRRAGDPWDLLNSALSRLAELEAKLAGPSPEDVRKTFEAMQADADEAARLARINAADLTAQLEATAKELTEAKAKLAAIEKAAAPASPPAADPPAPSLAPAAPEAPAPAEKPAKGKK